jgi:hypothetical protein
MSMKNSNDIIGNRTRALPACSAVQRVFMVYLITNRDSLVYLLQPHLLRDSTDRTFQTEAAVFVG